MGEIAAYVIGLLLAAIGGALWSRGRLVDKAEESRDRLREELREAEARLDREWMDTIARAGDAPHDLREYVNKEKK